MANEKISAMTPAAALTGAELVPLVQDGANVVGTAQDVANLGGGGGSSIHGENPTTDVAPGIASAAGGNAWAQATGDNQIGGNLILSGGIGSHFFTVVDYSALAGKTFTINIYLKTSVDPVTTTYTEGVEWTAAISNAATATSIAAAIGISAEAVDSVIFITPDIDSTGIVLTTNDTVNLTANNGFSGSVITGPIVKLGWNAADGNFDASTVAIGSGAGEQSSGRFLTAVGSFSGQLGSGDFVTAIGAASGGGNTNDGMTGVGFEALQGNTGLNATAIGAFAAMTPPNIFNNIISIGYNSKCNKDNTAQIGDENVHELYVGAGASNISMWTKIATLTYQDFQAGTLSGGDLVSTISAAYTTAADSLFSAVQIRVTEAFDAPTIATCALDASSFNAALTAVNMVPVAKTTNTTPETALKSGALSVAATAAGDTWPDFTAGSLDIWVLLSAVPA